jgi:hypothetical protein
MTTIGSSFNQPQPTPKPQAQAQGSGEVPNSVHELLKTQGSPQVDVRGEATYTGGITYETAE